MAVDWNAVNSALQQSRDGHQLEAIAMLSALLSHCDSNRDRAAILLGQSSCYSRLQNISKSRELLESAKMCATDERDLLSQVEMADASLYLLSGENEVACEQFASVKAKYRDLLILPENDDFAMELDSRFACALVDAGKHNDAIEIFQALFKRDKLDDRQRLQLYFGVACLRIGSLSEARSWLLEAMSGSDCGMAQSAADYLSTIGNDPHLGTRLM